MLLEHIVSPAEDGQTLRQLLRGAMALSGRQAREAFSKGAVSVDAAPFFSNQPVRTGMVVRVALGGYGDTPAPKDVPPVEVVFEDDALIAVFKPAPLQCHPSPSAPGGSDTLQARVTAYLGAPAHPVHRLDSETTGIVLFARLPFVQAHLQQQMQRGDFAKGYQAWVLGTPSPEAGTVDAPIARQSPDSFTRVVSPDGQRAVSRYRTLRTISMPGGQASSLLALSPVTGRTHQLRVHMAHIGCPLLGDARYGTAASQAISAQLGLTHHQLSAVSLRFVHPITGRQLELTHAPVFELDPEGA